MGGLNNPILSEIDATHATLSPAAQAAIAKAKLGMTPGVLPGPLQKDRCFGRGFPFYRFGRQIRYDLQEVRELIRSWRVEVGAARGYRAA